jgi:proteasome lid subunit RPN8/RPN11
MLHMSRAVAAEIAIHAEQTYPDECVGLLLGRLDGEQRRVVAVFPVENRWEGQVSLAASDDPASRRDRFYLDPRDYLRADRVASEQGLDIVGCYHSHPDHPPEPSERDRVGAQAVAGPSFAFAIQSVRDGVAVEFRSWLLIDQGDRFIAEPVEYESTQE